ncbi:MAG: aldo/keto reductase [Planctomycetota bacterium]|nr:aldo/keto reductase [Planctomycetota bacterium]
MKDEASPRGSGPSPDRREFLLNAGAVGGVATLGLPAGGRAQDGPGEIPRRPIGKAGDRISAMGLGGHHLADAGGVDEAVAIVHEAVDAGISFFDNCWEYNNGRAEDWLGRGLRGRRDKVFLMTKVCTHGRGADLALRMLEESLRRLRTDHLDLWQVHSMSFDNDPALAYARGGVLEAFDRAKKDGKVRFVGFTGHKDPSIHLEMVRRGYPFDAAQMPLNVFDATFRSFEQQVLPELSRRGIAALGMKPLNGRGQAVKAGLFTGEEMLRYAMSLPVATTITGMESLKVLRQNLAVARGFRPLSGEEMQALRDRAAGAAADGRFETYKLAMIFDNPQARLAHGYPLDPAQKEVKEMLEDEAGPP